jgi:hypothetical protein
VVRSGAGWRFGVITGLIIGDLTKVASEEQEGFMGLFPGQKAIGTDRSVMIVFASGNDAVRGGIATGRSDGDKLLGGYRHPSYPLLQD